MQSFTINWDAIGGITQIITVVYLFYQFHYLPNKERKEAIFNLKMLFLASRDKAQNLKNDLLYYSVRQECGDKQFIQGVTFFSQILQLNHLIENDLNDKVLDDVLKMCTSSYLITTAVDNVNKQLHSFTLLEAHFKTVYLYPEVQTIVDKGD